MADWHIGPAGALYLLPFRHPVLLAEEIATLATIIWRRAIFVGTNPASVAEAFVGLANLGYTDVIVRNLVTDQEQALATIGRLKEVKQLIG